MKGAECFSRRDIGRQTRRCFEQIQELEAKYVQYRNYDIREYAVLHIVIPRDVVQFNTVLRS